MLCGWHVGFRPHTRPLKVFGLFSFVCIKIFAKQHSKSFLKCHCIVDSMRQQAQILPNGNLNCTCLILHTSAERFI